MESSTVSTVFKVVLAGLAGALLAACTNLADNDTDVNGATAKTYTLAEVSQHSTEGDCWMAISGKVYDVTEFVKMHPGGDDILRGCGIDATTLFETQGGQGSHGSLARDRMKDYEIGVLSN